MKKFTSALAVISVTLSACATTSKLTGDAEQAKAEPAEIEIPNYETLVYGAEKPLVCTKPFLTEGELAK